MRIAVLVVLVACGGSESPRVTTGETTPSNTAPHTSGTTATPIDAPSPVDEQDDRGWTPLMHAAQMGKLDEVKALLARGANIEANSDTIYDHATPLLIALHYSQAETAAFLIARGASIAGTIGPQAITLAARNGDMDLVEYLLAHGIPASMSAVTLAAKYGYADVITRLVKAGAPVNAANADDHDYTPLIVACQENKGEAAAVLIKAGAKVDAVDDDGNTALYWAVFGARPIEVHEYEEMGQPHDTYWIPQGDAPVVKLLVDAKANVNARNKDGETPLHEAAYLDAAAAAQVLLDAGASRTAKNTNGLTPYDIAKERHNSVEPLVAPKRAGASKPTTRPATTRPATKHPLPSGP
jgi:ankyrin repeat protein